MNQQLMYQFSQEIAIQMPSLNKWQRDNLAIFSLGVVQAESCIQGKVAKRLRAVGKRQAVERRFQRFVSNDHLPLAKSQEEWTHWVVKSLVNQELILLVDETQLGDHVSAMVVGVAYEGRCIPLVWRCYQKAAYPHEGQVQLIMELLKRIQASLPAEADPLLQADRGIGTSPALIKAVDELGWRYLFRVQGSSKVIEADGTEYALGRVIQPGESWAAEGLVFKKRGRIPAQVRVIWDEDQEEPWALVTNDPTLTGREYAVRVWQEQSFRDLKSGGWQWNQSHIWFPHHTERLLLVLAVAYAWVLALGAYFIHAGQATPLRLRPDGSRRRRLSIFREGLDYLDFMSRQDHIVCLKLIFVPDKRLCS